MKRTNKKIEILSRHRVVTSLYNIGNKMAANRVGAILLHSLVDSTQCPARFCNLLLALRSCCDVIRLAKQQGQGSVMTNFPKVL